MGSKYKIKIPKVYSQDLAYIDASVRGDGTLTRSGFRIQISDKCAEMHTKVLQPKLLKLFGIKFRIVKKGNGWLTEIKSKELFNYLASYLEIPIGNKSEIVKIPKIVFESGAKIQKGHLKGWMDAEGAIKYKKYKTCIMPRLGFASKSKNVRNGIIKILEKLGKELTIDLSTWKWRSTDGMYHLEFAGPETVYNYMKFIGLEHPDKNQRMQTLLKNYF